MEITVGYWETMGGSVARVLCTDAPGSHPVVGYIEINGAACAYAWKSDGKSGVFEGSPSDLIRQRIDRPVIDWSLEREWVKAVAMDAIGNWFRCSLTPSKTENGQWIDDGGAPCELQWMHPSEFPKFTGSWKDSLCVRPEVKA